MRKVLAEFIGTFALVFCGTAAIVINEERGGVITHVGIAITFGLIVMAMIYAFGEISGAHLNPAVSIAFAAAKKFEIKNLLPYISAQIFGALLASVILKVMFPQNTGLGTTTPSGGVWQSFWLEFILTFLLMLVIIKVSSGSKEQGMFAGLAIGSVVLLEAMFGGPVSGASMNPARSIGPAIISGHIAQLWIYILAPTSGALTAVYISKFLKSK